MDGILLDAFLKSLHITGVVMVMMALIELLGMVAKGNLLVSIRKFPLAQIVLSALLGAIPGCMGGFAVVSLYSHGLVSFGALVAMMIATTGDEAFAMFTLYPSKAALILVGLFVLGIVVGLLVDRFVKNPFSEAQCHVMEAEKEERQPLGKRLLHVLKHLPGIFLWTFGALLLVGFGMEYLDLESWMGKNVALLVLVAGLVGLIPESGPHMVFVTLFASGVIPAPVLIASCISQDGHAALPLLGQSRKAFIVVKASKLLLSLALGYASMLLL